MSEKMMNTDEGKPRGAVDRQLRKFFRWLLSLRGSPESIGLGVAIGIFVAFSPLLGVHFILAVILATLLGANRPAALATSLTNNPATVVPILVLDYGVGSLVWPGPPVGRVKQILGELVGSLTGAGFFNVQNHLNAVGELGLNIFIPMLIGGTLFGLISAVATYFPVVALVAKLRSKREKRRRARQEN